MQSAPAIQLKNITKRFGNIVANKEVSLFANRGEILSILGENGSGKTELILILLPLLFQVRRANDDCTQS